MQRKAGVGSKAEKVDVKLKSILADDLEFLSDSELLSPRQQLKQEILRASGSSLRNNLLTQSQEGVLDDLMDISRDQFKPLEVVHEESRTLHDATYDQLSPRHIKEQATHLFSTHNQEQDSKRSAVRISSRYDQEGEDDQVIQTSMEFTRVQKKTQKKEAPLTQEEYKQRMYSPHPQLLKK